VCSLLGGFEEAKSNEPSRAISPYYALFSFLCLAMARSARRTRGNVRRAYSWSHLREKPHVLTKRCRKRSDAFPMIGSVATLTHFTWRSTFPSWIARISSPCVSSDTTPLRSPLDQCERLDVAFIEVAASARRPIARPMRRSATPSDVTATLATARRPGGGGVGPPDSTPDDAAALAAEETLAASSAQASRGESGLEAAAEEAEAGRSWASAPRRSRMVLFHTWRVAGERE